MTTRPPLSAVGSVQHGREDGPDATRGQGADPAENSDSRTFTDAQRRERARLRMDEAKQEHARFFRVACENHPGHQQGVADLIGVARQHVTQMCNGQRTIPAHAWSVLARYAPRAYAAGMAAMQEAYGAHRDPVDPDEAARAATKEQAEAIAKINDPTATVEEKKKEVAEAVDAGQTYLAALNPEVARA